MTRGLRALIAAAAIAATTAVVVTDGGRVEAAPLELADPTPRPLGAVTVLGDSVMLGSLLVGPTIVDALGERGWGPIRARAGEGYRTGYVFAPETSKATYWLERWRAEGWDAPNVIVNLGANDMGFCALDDPECSYEAIMHLVDAIGPGPRVWWPKVTRSTQFATRQANWNRALDRVVAEHDHVATWDWPAVMAAGSFPSPDGAHLSADGYRLRTQLMADRFTADAARARAGGRQATAPAPSGDPSRVVSVGPERLVDTRVDPPGRLAAGATLEVDVAAHVPPSTSAVAVYLAATGTADRGYLTASDCSAPRPTASAVSYAAGATRGSMSIVPVSADGTICVFTRADADLIVDLQAAFVPSGDGLRLTPLATPTRLLDTRLDGRGDVLRVPVAQAADVAVVSIAAIGRGEPGFVAAYACGDDVPSTASVNHGADEVVNSTALVPVGDDSSICLFVRSGADVTVDLTGVLRADGQLSFVPARPTRTVDTRSGVGGWLPIHGRDQTIDATVAPADAAAVSGTLTIVEPLEIGHLRAWGCGALPSTANVNGRPGTVLANSLISAVDDDGRLCLYARSATTTIFDTTGWWVESS